MLERLQQFLHLADRARAIADTPGVSWEAKFDLVFADEVSLALRALDVPFEADVPDTSYEEDVRGFVHGVTEAATDLRAALPMLLPVPTAAQARAEPLAAFGQLAAAVRAIVESPMRLWSTKFHLVFGPEVRAALDASGIPLAYHDPDTSYEEDVRAFADALDERAREVRAVAAAGDAAINRPLRR